MAEIVHICDDRSLGGITRLLDTLQRSALALRFDMRIQSAVHALEEEDKAREARLYVVHNAVSWTSLWTLGRLAARHPLVLMEHHYSAAFEDLNVPDVYRFRTLLRMSYRFATVVVAISEAQRRWMEEAKLAPASKIRVISPVVDLSDLLSLPPQNWDGSRPLVLGAYGRFHEQKGFVPLLRALAEARDLDCKLLLGGFGPLEPAIQRLAEADERIELVGKVTCLERFLAATDVVVVPSLWEPYGLTCLEARAAGRPVLVADVDALPEQAVGCGATFRHTGELAERIRGLSPESLAPLGPVAQCSAAGALERRLDRWGELFSTLAA